MISETKKGNPLKPPKTVFLPSKKILRQMIRALAQFGKDDHFRFLLRFALLENPNVVFQERPIVEKQKVSHETERVRGRPIYSVYKSSRRDLDTIKVDPQNSKSTLVQKKVNFAT